MGSTLLPGFLAGTRHVRVRGRIEGPSVDGHPFARRSLAAALLGVAAGFGGKSVGILKQRLVLLHAERNLRRSRNDV